MDEFGPLNLQPHPGRQWAERGGKRKDPEREPRPRRRATYTRPHGVRHLFAAYDLGRDQLYGHIKKAKTRSKFPEFCRYLRSLHPVEKRIAIVCDNYSPHLTTKRCSRVADWYDANNVEIAYTPTNSSWLNRIGCVTLGLWSTSCGHVRSVTVDLRVTAVKVAQEPFSWKDTSCS
ncbi:transposase [Streptomyces sp. NBC_01092]|nr:transposase [Streptomyces sp. NBC_01092]